MRGERVPFCALDAPFALDAFLVPDDDVDFVLDGDFDAGFDAALFDPVFDPAFDDVGASDVALALEDDVLPVGLRLVRFFLPPSGNAPPTAFIVPPATSPTVSTILLAVLLAVLPTVLTTLPALGISVPSWLHC